MEATIRASSPRASDGASKITWSYAPLSIVSDPAYEYDVQKRVPSVDKARDVLGFECTTTLDVMLDEVIPWIEKAVADGLL